ncbi:hypothetical protein SSAG_05935 [Streptomyces sp. Mg1]|nr:hypothetical protein SSAG_05935 [Streptomyces sp. Mg1]
MHKPAESSWRRIRFANMTDGQERAGHEGCPGPSPATPAALAAKHRRE